MEAKKVWDQWGKNDPMWGVITSPSKKDNRWITEEFYESGRVDVELFKFVLSKKNFTFSGNRVLDFGIGPGRIAVHLIGTFKEVYGLDISKSMIDFGKEKMEKAGVKPILYDGLSPFPFKNNFFDYVYTNGVIQHQKHKNAKKYINEMIRVTSKKGIILIEVPVRLSESYIKKNKTRLLLRKIIPDIFLNLKNNLFIFISTFTNKPIMRMENWTPDEINEVIKGKGILLFLYEKPIRYQNWVEGIYLIQKL